MAEINFSTGDKTYIVNGTAEIKFCPEDINFAGDVFDLVEEIRKLSEQQEPKDPSKVYEIARLRDNKVRDSLDNIFGEGTSEAIFGKKNVFSSVGGVPICLNFLMKIIDEIDTAADNMGKVSPEVEAYLNKYKAKYGNRVK